MKALIVDDEKHCRSVIRTYLESTKNEITEIQESNSVTSTLRTIEAYQPEIVFLDIQLGGQTSFEILEALEEINFQIIFTTAYDDYALEAFKYAAIHYLMKPIDKKELLEALERCAGNESKYSKEQIEEARGIFLRQENKAFNVPYKEISYLLADGGYTKIFKTDGECIFTSKNLGEYEKMVPENSFFRIHKSTLVNLAEVDSIDLKNSTVKMKSEETLEYSRRKKAALKQAMAEIAG